MFLRLEATTAGPTRTIRESNLVVPVLGPGIHVFLLAVTKDVDGRDKPGHDEDGEAAFVETAYPTGKSLARFSPLAIFRYLDRGLNSPACKIQFIEPLQYVWDVQALDAK
jgi:hypothetical protein